MEWLPLPKQEKFLRLPWYEAMFGGAKGPGKTDALLMDSTYQIEKPNYKAIIFRRTFPKLQEIIDRSHKWFRKSAHWNGDLHRWTWKSGATLQFAHCKNEEDKYNHQGQEYHYMGFDQLEEFTESQYLFLVAQNRTSDKTLKCFVRSTSNPGNVGHAWVKRRFIDCLSPIGEPKYFLRNGEEDIEVPKGTPKALSRAFVFSRLEDNIMLMQADPLYESRLNMLPEKLRRALREGDWDAYEGQYFDEWRKEIHVIRPYNIEEPRKNVIGIDYGYAKPSSVGWYACLPDGDIIRYREFYKEGYSYESLARKILELTPASEKIEYAVGDPAIWGDRSHHKDPKDGELSGEVGNESMQKVFGSRITLLKADNSRVAGWIRFRDYLQHFVDQWGHKSAKFRVFSTCINFIRTMPGLIHDELNPEDVDTTGEDHAEDEARYVIMSRPPLPKHLPKPQTPTEEFWGRVKKDIKESENDEDGELVSIGLDGAEAL
ncbi:MAG: terminase family protein [Candidatus Omnitrophota bacterium]|jgi:hypothetical protein